MHGILYVYKYILYFFISNLKKSNENKIQQVKQQRNDNNANKNRKKLSILVKYIYKIIVLIKPNENIWFEIKKRNEKISDIFNVTL